MEKTLLSGRAAGHAAIYIKKTVGRSVKTERQTVKIVFSLYICTNIVTLIL